MNFKIRRMIPAMLSAAMLFAALQLPAFASGTKYEAEPNNTTSKADTTYDDYNNYGTISSTADVDFWRFTPSETCFANIWLGNIPTSCSYTLTLMDSDDNAVAMTKDHQYGSQKIMKCRLVGGRTYYVSIHSDSGCSADVYYHFRIKTYDLGVGRIFTTDSGSYDSSATGNIKSTLWSMGYDANNYLNNSANALYSTLTNSRILMIHSEARNGYMVLPCSTGSTYFYGYNYSGIESYSRALGTLATNSMNNMALAIFLGTDTAIQNNTYGNLVDMALVKGASCAIGWYGTVDPGYGTEWAESFFEYLSQGRSVERAIGFAESQASSARLSSFADVVDFYTGASDLGAIAP